MAVSTARAWLGALATRSGPGTRPAVGTAACVAVGRHSSSALPPPRPTTATSTLVPPARVPAARSTPSAAVSSAVTKKKRPPGAAPTVGAVKTAASTVSSSPAAAALPRTIKDGPDVASLAQRLGQLGVARTKEVHVFVDDASGATEQGYRSTLFQGAALPQVGAILRSIAHACSAHADPTLNFYQVENAPYSHPVRELRSAGFEPIAISSRNKDNFADQLVMVDMWSVLFKDRAEPKTLILLTNKARYSSVVASIVNQGHTVVVVGPKRQAHQALGFAPTCFLAAEDVLPALAEAPAAAR